MIDVTQPKSVWYRTVCSQVNSDAEDYFTYGLQCMGDCKGVWVQMDVIEDVSPSRDSVLRLADQFNSHQLSHLHFRDAVQDSVSL